VSDELSTNREHQRTLKAKYMSGKKVTSKDQKELDMLERKERLLSRKSHMLEASNNTCWTTLWAILRPFQFVFGILLLLIAAFLFISILLTR